MRTRVCITIDTEFSIAGAFSKPTLLPVAEPMVLCNVAGRSEGLGFLLKCFREHKIPATFFVEALHRYFFKQDPMRPLVRLIEDEGHELQLHVHPCWSVFQHQDWRDRVQREPRQDDFFGRDEDDSVRLIEGGIDVFKDWGLPRPKIFRSGSLQHDDVLYRALARAGIPYSSNVGIAIFECGDPNYKLYGGRHVRHGVVEFPVQTFNDWSVPGRQHLRTLTIAGTSFAEMRALLDNAQRVGVAQLVILTHPFEYIQSLDMGREPSRRHSLNQQRLTALCEYLDQNRDRFHPCELGDAAAASAGEDPIGDPLLRGAPWHSVGRMAAQVAYDKFGNWALSRVRGARQ